MSEKTEEGRRLIDALEKGADAHNAAASAAWSMDRALDAARFSIRHLDHVARDLRETLEKVRAERDSARAESALRGERIDGYLREIKVLRDRVEALTPMPITFTITPMQILIKPRDWRTDPRPGDRARFALDPVDPERVYRDGSSGAARPGWYGRCGRLLAYSDGAPAYTSTTRDPAKDPIPGDRFVGSTTGTVYYVQAVLPSTVKFSGIYYGGGSVPRSSLGTLFRAEVES